MIVSTLCTIPRNLIQLDGLFPLLTSPPQNTINENRNISSHYTQIALVCQAETFCEFCRGAPAASGTHKYCLIKFGKSVIAIGLRIKELLLGELKQLKAPSSSLNCKSEPDLTSAALLLDSRPNVSMLARFNESRLLEHCLHVFKVLEKPLHLTSKIGITPSSSSSARPAFNNGRPTFDPPTTVMSLSPAACSAC